MANRRDYYFKQNVTEAELDAGFEGLEQADRALASDLGFFGMIAGGQVVQHAAVANLTVDVGSGGIAYDQVGERVFWSATQNVDVSQDNAQVATAVAAPGNEKWVSVFAAFARTLSDPRIDGNSNALYFQRDESFSFYVTQGAEAAIGAALKPALQSDKVLLADVHRTNGQTQVLNADISTARRQDAVVIAGTPQTIRRGLLKDAVADVLGYYNAHVTGAADRHAAAQIDYAGGTAWADGTTNPAADVETQIDSMLSALGAGAGTAKIHGNAVAGSTFTLGAGTLAAQLAAVVAAIENKRVIDVDFAVVSANIGEPYSTASAAFVDVASRTLATAGLRAGDVVVSAWMFGLERANSALATAEAQIVFEEAAATQAATAGSPVACSDAYNDPLVRSYTAIATRTVGSATGFKTKLQLQCNTGAAATIRGPVLACSFVLRTG